MNAKLNKFRADRQYSYTDGLPAVSFVVPPKKPMEAPLIFLVTDRVRTTLHLVSCKPERPEGSQARQYVLRQPWAISKSHTVFDRLYKMVAGKVPSPGPISVIEFMVRVTQAACSSK